MSVSNKYIRVPIASLFNLVYQQVLNTLREYFKLKIYQKD